MGDLGAKPYKNIVLSTSLNVYGNTHISIYGFWGGLFMNIYILFIYLYIIALVTQVFFYAIVFGVFKQPKMNTIMMHINIYISPMNSHAIFGIPSPAQEFSVMTEVRSFNFFCLPTGPTAPL